MVFQVSSVDFLAKALDKFQSTGLISGFFFSGLKIAAFYILTRLAGLKIAAFYILTCLVVLMFCKFVLQYFSLHYHQAVSQIKCRELLQAHTSQQVCF